MFRTALISMFLTSTALAGTPVQWLIEDGGNGHWYQAVETGGPVTWTDAFFHAESLGGYLATLTSEAEDQWLFKTLVNDPLLWNSRSGPLIGAYQNLKSPLYSEPDGGWEWVTGEPWNYANWQDGQPDDWSGNEHFAHFKAVGDGPPLDQWNDLPTPTLIDPIAFIVEYDNLGPTTWTVDDDGKADFDNIQAAVDAASDGDEIMVMPGTYTGKLNAVIETQGKEVWLHSSDGPEVTILDGEQIRRGVLCDSGETNSTIIEGFTITNGSGYGGGMSINYSSPTVKNCIFTDNHTPFDGGGMYNNYSNPTLINCTFDSNTANAGGGMYNISSNPTLTNCTFTGNTATLGGCGGMCNILSSPSLTSCTFEGNSAKVGGGMGNLDSSPILTNCTFTGNTANNGGGMYNSSRSNTTLTDTTVCGNTPDQIYGGYTDGGGNTIADVCPIDCPADVNQDGVVDLNDILALVGAWGSSGPLGDINDDGTVNVVDLIMMLKSWGPCE
jgi:hypothetical protein